MVQGIEMKKIREWMEEVSMPEQWHEDFFLTLEVIIVNFYLDQRIFLFDIPNP